MSGASSGASLTLAWGGIPDSDQHRFVQLAKRGTKDAAQKAPPQYDGDEDGDNEGWEEEDV